MLTATAQPELLCHQLKNRSRGMAQLREKDQFVIQTVCCS